ncbi:hypothetical protein N7517_009939 [Penicillium concentricum]|uniref:BTB domain-containing protein n=1 Tax=Penicillium concentricum TaxID=293559 RepID=A0A9W9RNC5_9EURO|nr:uncharacterized protein N7517_009939 [Penicillium concentricum]KAJ5360748.1 hypothetical protein N7517_009939 [Penicillium concentricum]
MSSKEPADIQELGPGIERFDPDGDVIIVSEGESPDDTRRFLVSSKVLSLASPVFAKLFGPNFYEGTQMATCTCPELHLHDDDPAMMKEVPGRDTECIANLTIHGDKYDCVKALRPWVSTWIHNFDVTPSTEEFGHLIVAAHLL